MKIDMERPAEDGVEQIIEVLNEFQEGYKTRDLKEIDIFVNELFTNNRYMGVYSTDQDEDFYGIDAACKFVESDWKYWG